MKRPRLTLVLANPEAVEAVVECLDDRFDVQKLHTGVFETIIQELLFSPPDVFVIELPLVRDCAGKLVGFVRKMLPHTLVIAHNLTPCEADASVLEKGVFFYSSGNSPDRLAEVIHSARRELTSQEES